MVDIEMINKIKGWGFAFEEEYHRIKAHDGIIGIKDEIITDLELFNLWYDYYEDYLELKYPEFLEEIAINPVNVGDYMVYKAYKLYHVYAIEITTFSDYLGDEFEEYLKENDIQAYGYDNSDIEEFFEEYGIEVY